jgi:FG-GAP repeat
MQKVIWFSLCLLATVFASGRSLGAEIKGKVIEVKDVTVKITTDSELIPSVGDQLEIVFAIPGVDDVAHVAEGKVTEIGGDFILAKIERAKGKVAKNQIVRIISNNPVKRVASAIRPSSGPAYPRSTIPAAGKKIRWKKTVIDTKFRGEGVAVGDFNHDGKIDIAVGSVYYTAPDWQMHLMADKAPDFDPHGYSDAFMCYSDDLTTTAGPT